MRFATLFALLLAGAPAAQPHRDPCVAMNRYTAGGVTWWQWSWYNLHITNWAHIELVPYGGGVGMLCVFNGAPRSNAGWLPRVGFYPNEVGQLPGCNSPIQWPMIEAFWWMDLQSIPGDRLCNCTSMIVPDLPAEPTGMRMNYSAPMPFCDAGLGQQDLVVTQSTAPQWYRWPTYWAVLLRPGRGYW